MAYRYHLIGRPQDVKTLHYEKNIFNDNTFLPQKKSEPGALRYSLMNITYIIPVIIGKKFWFSWK